MRVLIDANVIVDALLPVEARLGGDKASAIRVLDAVAEGTVRGVITPILFAFVVHAIKPRRKEHRERMAAALAFLLDITEWAPVTAEHCRAAMASSFHDVEDGIQFFAAGGGKLDAIITRDTKDYREHVHVPVMTASEFVKKHLK
jgi:predicted nucleic acid-binding protein